MPIYEAVYFTHLEFIVPKTISKYLLDAGDNRNNGRQVGSWWIRYGTFHYIDRDGKNQSIQTEDIPDVDYKHPNGEIEIRECDGGEDEEEEDEEEDEEEEKTEKKVVSIDELLMRQGCEICRKKPVIAYPIERMNGHMWLCDECAEWGKEKKPRVRRKRIMPPAEKK